MKKFDAVRLIGLGGMLLGGLAALITSYSQEQQMKQLISDEVDKALAEREEENEEEI